MEKRKEIEESKLGNSAHNIILNSIAGKDLSYEGKPDLDLPYNHIYEIVNINYGPNTLIVKDKTDGKLLSRVPLVILPHFYEILRG
jgi:hypothetical protein